MNCNEMQKFRLKDICTLVTSGGTPLSTVAAYYEPKEIPWLKTGEVNYSRIYDTVEHISKEGLTHSSAKLIPTNSVIIAMYGQGNTAGRVAINKIPLATNQACCNLIINENRADYEYVYYLLSTLYNQFVLMKNGGAQPNLNAEKIKNMEVYLPPLELQHKVANVLARYDDLIENNQKQIKLLEEAAQRLYKEWFVDLRFPGYEQTKIVDGVPEGWTIETLSAIADIVMGQSPKSEFYNSNKEGLPFHQGVGSYGERFVNDEIFTTSFTRIAESFSVLFSVRAPVGRINITQNRIVIGRGLAALIHKKGFQSFLYYMLKEFFFKEDIIGNGAIFASISKEELCSLLFLNPSIDIVKKFEKHSKRIDEKILLLNKQKILLAEARDRLLPKLMNGEIEV